MWLYDAFRYHIQDCIRYGRVGFNSSVKSNSEDLLECLYVHPCSPQATT